MKATLSKILTKREVECAKWVDCTSWHGHKNTTTQTLFKLEYLCSYICAAPRSSTSNIPWVGRQREHDKWPGRTVRMRVKIAKTAG